MFLDNITDTYDKDELIDEWELCECMACHKPHLGYYEKCPECGAGIYYQVAPEPESFSIKELKEKIIKARELKSRRMIAKGREMLADMGIEE